MTLPDRFWLRTHVEDRGYRTPCIIWTGETVKGGYGRVHLGGPKVLAHRAVYEAAKGSIPLGMTIDHLCRVSACVNVEHLEAVTQQVNNLRAPGTSSGENARKTHCPQGHPYTEENTHFTPQGWRRCRTCRKAKAK